MRNHANHRNHLFVLPNDDLGGAEQILKMLAFQYKNEEVDVFFLSRSKSGGWNTLSSELNLNYGSFDSIYLGALELVFNFLLKPRRKIYNCTFTSHVFITSLVGLLIRSGFIRTRHFIGRESTVVSKRFRGIKLAIYRLMYRIGYSAVDLLICQTDYMKDELINAFPHLEQKLKIIVIPNPVNLQDAIALPAIDGKLEHGCFLVSAGRLIPEKGFDILIHVFKELKVEFPQLKLLILGEGKERTYLTDLATIYKLEKDITLKGFVPNVYPYFRAARVCVVSSLVEGFPNVLLQMMSQNTSVVSTLCAGGIDQIEGIYTAKPGSKDDLYKSIKQALEEDCANRKVVFDQFLKGRSIHAFIARIEEELQILD